MSHVEPDSISDSLNESFSTERLKSAVRSGTRWLAASQVASQLVSLVVLALLYRRVHPADFGLVGMVLPLLYFLQIFNLTGLNMATVQLRELSDARATTLFWAQVTLGAATTLLALATAPILPWIYNEPRVLNVALALAVTPLLASLSQQHIALLERKLRVGPVAAARLIAQIAGGATGVILALRGGTVWALVAQQYVEYSMLVLIVWQLERWRPRSPWSGDPVASVVRVGGAITAMNLGQFVLVNCDKVLVGMFYGPVALGLYGQAFNLMMKPVTIVTNPLGSIMLAALSRAQLDGATYRYVLSAFLRLAAVIGFPCGVGLWVVATDAMFVLGGSEWIPAGPILQILSPVIIARCSMNVGTNIFISSGAWGRMTVAVWSRALAAMLGVALAASMARAWHSDDVVAASYVAWGYTLAIAGVVFLPYMTVALGAVGITLRSWVLLVARPALAALAMGVLVWFVGTLIDRTAEPRAILRLAAQVGVGVVAYTVLAWRDVRWCLAQLRAW